MTSYGASRATRHAVVGALLAGAVVCAAAGVVPAAGAAAITGGPKAPAHPSATPTAPIAPDVAAALASVGSTPAVPIAVTPPAPAPAQAPVPSTVTRLSAVIGGLERRWVLVAPAAGAGPVDLVIALHGVGGDGTQMRWLGIESLAGPAGVAVAFPDAAYGAWNDGRPGADVLSPDGKGADDIGFLRLLVQRSGAAMDRDVRAVGVVGFSNGAMMASRVACEMSDLVSVVAIVAGSAPEGFQNGCRPAHPVSVAVIAAKGDPIVPFNGGQVAPFQGRPRGRVSGVEATVAFWTQIDDCRATETPPTGPAAPAVGATESANCDATRHVARYVTDDASHDWRRTGGFDTTSVVWSFVHDELPRFATAQDYARAGLLLLG